MRNADLDIDYGNDLRHVIVSWLNNGDMGDDYESDGMGDGMVRFGRRVQYWDQMGFVACDTFASMEDAEQAFARARENYYGECEKCGESVHIDSESQYEHAKYECEPTETTDHPFLAEVKSAELWGGTE